MVPFSSKKVFFFFLLKTINFLYFYVCQKDQKPPRSVCPSALVLNHCEAHDFPRTSTKELFKKKWATNIQFHLKEKHNNYLKHLFIAGFSKRKVNC